MPYGSTPPGAAASKSSSTPPALPPRSLKKDTLLLFGGLPPGEQPPELANGSTAIVVPAPAEKAPKAVTQAPPWTDGSARLGADIPKAPPPMRARAESIEEISDAMLVPVDTDSSSAAVTVQRTRLDEASSALVLKQRTSIPPPLPGAAHGTIVGMPGTILPPVSAPPRRESVTAPPIDTSGAEENGTRRLVLAGERIIHDLRLLLARPQKRWFLPAVGVGGAFVLVCLIALVVGLLRPSPNDEIAAKPSASAAPSVASSAAGAANPPSAAPPPSLAACSLGGGPHVLAPKAMVPSGVEATANGGRLAIGFAVGPKEGMALEIEPGSLSVVGSAKAHVHDPIRRLIPAIGSSGRLSAVADSDHKGDRLQGARTIPGEPLFLAGASDGQLAWAPHAGDVAKVLWPLQGDGAVEALRGVETSDKGYVLAFRQAGAIWLGALRADKTPKGMLERVSGLGPTVGSPTLASSGDGVLVAWADRASPSDPWAIRWLHWKPGVVPDEARSFVLPPGGLGEQAMSPGLSTLSGGRFLLVWTEGPVSSHQVRAQTISPSGAPLGAPMTISEDGVNAGQGQAAVTSDGKGVVVFLASNGTGFEVNAVPIVCASGEM